MLNQFLLYFHVFSKENDSFFTPRLLYVYFLRSFCNDV